MTPVAGRIANAHKQQAVGCLGELQSVGRPKLPGCGIVHVGSHIWAFAVAAAIAERDAVGGSRVGQGHGGVVEELSAVGKGKMFIRRRTWKAVAWDGRRNGSANGRNGKNSGFWQESESEESLHGITSTTTEAHRSINLARAATMTATIGKRSYCVH